MSVARETLTELSPRVRVRQGVAAKQLSTFAVGADVELVLEPQDLLGVEEVLAFLSSEQLPWRILGAGSNVVLPDSPLNEAVIRFSGELSKSFAVSQKRFSIDDIEHSLVGFEQSAFVGEETFSVFSYGGASLIGLSRRTSSYGLSGLEFAAGIPASLGGAVRMNAGAHGSSISEVLSRALVLGSGTPLRFLSREELDFSYRSSAIARDTIVVAAEIELMPGVQQEISAERNRCLEYRKQTQPLHLPSAGSVFRNPQENGEVKFFAAELLERAGLKGERRGGVMFSELHANWLVKCGEQARASEVQELVTFAQQKVSEQFGIHLQSEIIFW